MFSAKALSEKNPVHSRTTSISSSAQGNCADLLAKVADPILIYDEMIDVGGD